MPRSAQGLTVFLVAAALLLVQQPGQSADTQRYRVRVRRALSIRSPANRVTITHDQSDADQVFPAQPWDVQCNAISGATVTFDSRRPFRRGNNYQRDARLDLAIASSDAPASWTVTVPTDQTDYAAGDDDAVVQATSLRAGDATFNLTVTFITVDYSTLAEGQYRLRVTGTITAN